MKKILITLMTLAAVTVQGQTTTAQLTCHNKMYRDSTFVHSPGNVLRISDNYAVGLEPILEKISANHNLGYLISRNVQLDVALDNKDVECQTVGAFPMICQGRKDHATLHVQATFTGGEISLALRVALKSLNLNGALTKQGPIEIGNGQTIVPFDEFLVDATAQVIYQGVPASLNFNTFFYTRDDDADLQNLSSCSIYQP